MSASLDDRRWNHSAARASKGHAAATSGPSPRATSAPRRAGGASVDASPAAAGGRESVGHFVAGPHFVDADEARREVAQIPDGAGGSAPATPPSRRLAELDAAILAEARRGAELWERACRWQGDAGCTWVEPRTWPPLRKGLDFACFPPPERRRVAYPRAPVEDAKG